MTQVLQELSYGKETIRYRLTRRDRKTLQISVLPDMTVEVTAPNSAHDEDVVHKLRKRGAWICRQIRYFSQFQPKTPERQYLAGETHLYLGRCYRLKIIQSIEKTVKLKRGYIEIHTQRPSSTVDIRRQLDGWYKLKAHDQFHRRLALCIERFPDTDLHTPRALIVRQLKQRWGSMSAARRLVLNRALIKAAQHEIDYVITHELCHLRYHHHGPKFYELLSRVMPDWQSRKESLEHRLS